MLLICSDVMCGRKIGQPLVDLIIKVKETKTSIASERIQVIKYWTQTKQIPDFVTKKKNIWFSGTIAYILLRKQRYWLKAMNNSLIHRAYKKELVTQDLKNWLKWIMFNVAELYSLKMQCKTDSLCDFFYIVSFYFINFLFLLVLWLRTKYESKAKP